MKTPSRHTDGSQQAHQIGEEFGSPLPPECCQGRLFLIEYSILFGLQLLCFLVDIGIWVVSAYSMYEIMFSFFYYLALFGRIQPIQPAFPSRNDSNGHYLLVSLHFVSFFSFIASYYCLQFSFHLFSKNAASGASNWHFTSMNLCNRPLLTVSLFCA